MSCISCSNTTVTVKSTTSTVVAGVVTPADGVVLSSVKAYREARGTEITRGEVSLSRRRVLFVIESTLVKPEHTIIDEGDSNRQYFIEEYQDFENHVELICLEERADD